jgi:hypothetical protein
MRSARVWATLSGVAVLASTSLSYAQCTKDVDCKGERICQEGNCVEPPTAAATAVAPDSTVAAPGPGATPTAAAPPAAAPAAALPPPITSDQAPITSDQQGTQPIRYKRNSSGMFAGGIVMVSIGALALGVAIISTGTERCTSGAGSTSFSTSCESSPNYTAYLISAALLGGGIPMIIIGGKRVPADPQAGLSPWVTPQGGGLRFQLTL